MSLTLKPLVGNEPWFKTLTSDSRVYIILSFWVVGFLCWFLWIIVHHSKHQSHHPSDHLIPVFSPLTLVILGHFLRQNPWFIFTIMLETQISKFPAGTSISLQASFFHALYLQDHGTSTPPVTKPTTSITFTPTAGFAPSTQLAGVPWDHSSCLNSSSHFICHYCDSNPLKWVPTHPPSSLPIILITNAIIIINSPEYM